MADHTILPGVGDTIAADDVGGVKYQIVKAAFGALDTATLVSSTNPMPVYGPDATTTGTITATDAVGAAPAGAGAFINAASTAGSIVSVACAGGDSAWNVQITGQTTGAIHFEASLDSTNGTDGNWINCNGRQTGIVNTVLAGNATAGGYWRGNTSGAKYFRVRHTGTLTGTPAVLIRISDGVGATFLNASIPSGTNYIGQSDPRPATTWVNATAATGSAVTATLAAAGAGLFHYITAIEIQLYATSARTGGATPLVVTTTNLTGSPAWTFSTAQAIGATETLAQIFGSPLKTTTANTATTIVAPAATTGLWRINVAYFTAA